MKEAIAKIKYAMEHHSGLNGLVPIARRLGIVHLLHMISEKIDRKDLEEEGTGFRKFYELHEEEFQKLSEMLEDDFSRTTLDRVLEYRKVRKLSVLKDVIVEPQYFQKDIFEPVEDEVFIDGGAYTGDTIQDFIRYFAGRGGYREIYAWEPDAANRKQMRKNLRGYKNIQVIPYGMWKEKGDLYLSLA